MNSSKFYILILLGVMALASCSDDKADQPAEIAWAVRAAWQDGLAGGQSSRALAATDLLADVSQGDIAIDFADYPAEISITCKNGSDDVIDEFQLTNDRNACDDEPTKYWSYTPGKIYTDMRIRSGNLKFLATAVIDDDGDPETTDDGDILEGTANMDDISHGHLHMELRHTKALLRFAFKVSEKYDRVRSIMVKDILFNGKQCHVEQKVLNKTGMTYIAYAYIDNPEDFDLSVNNSHTMVCTYDIYDKDARFDGAMSPAELATHLTRQDVKAQNTFTLTLKDNSSTPITQLSPGYYYDLRVTLNPDYLYVLSEHDNKHMTIE